MLILIASGFRAASAMDPAAKAVILRVHLAIVVEMLPLMIVWIVWWRGPDRKRGLRAESSAGRSRLPK
jgi:hypothetical protein